MAQKIYENVDFMDHSSGMFDSVSVADAIMPVNSVRHAVNVEFGRPRGAISQRRGTTVLGDQAGAGGADIKGLYNFRSQNGTDSKLLVASNTVIRYLNGSAWTNTITGLTTTLKTRFITFLNRVAFMNGTDQAQAWAGTGAWETTGGPLDIANYPDTKFAVLLKSRILAAGNATNPCRIFESSLPSAGAISWTSGYRNTDVFADDGNGNINGLASNGRVVIIFKERAQYRYDGDSLVFIVNIGTTSHESLCTDDQGVMYFFGQGANSVGFYASTGGYPQKISRPIQKWIEAIDPDYYDDIAGFTDGNTVRWSIGSVTMDGVIYANAWLVYNISDKTWTTANYTDRFLVFSQYIDSTGNITTVAGDTDGYVQTIDSGNTDNGTGISYECERAPIFFGQRGTTKYIDQLTTHCTDIQGMNVGMRIDGKYNFIGGINQKNKKFDNLNLRGRKMSPMIFGINSGEPFIFDGFSFPRVIDEGNIYG